MIQRLARAEISLGALRHNLVAARELGGGRKVCAVVKARAYGHGALDAARAFVSAGADFLAVAILEEAIELRDAGIESPILVLGWCDPGNAAISVDRRITHTVFEPSLAEALSREGLRRGIRVPVHVKVDTGMNRLGLRPEDVRGFARLLRALPGLAVEGTYSHFANAEVGDLGFAREQLSLFLEAIAEMKAEGVDPGLRHMAASGAILDFPESRLDMVRPGIILYGLSPFGDREPHPSLKPAMRLTAGVTMVKTVPAGETVSYGRTFATARESRIATLPIGYADGYPRALSNRGSVVLRGRRAPVVGRVCMDQCMVDVTDIPGVAAGDEALVVGGPELPVGEMSRLLGTIDYEVTCMVSARVPRIGVE